MSMTFAYNGCDEYRATNVAKPGQEVIIFVEPDSDGNDIFAATIGGKLMRYADQNKVIRGNFLKVSRHLECQVAHYVTVGDALTDRERLLGKG